MKKNGTYGSHLKFNIKRKNEIKEMKGKNRREGKFILFLFYKLLSLIHRVSIVRIRRAKNESSSTRRGLRVSTKNTGFHREFK